MSIKKKLQENSDKIEKRLEEFEKIGYERLAKIPEKIEEFMTKKGISRRQGIVIIFIIALIFFTLTGDIFKVDSWYPLRISWVNPVASIQKTINTVNKESKK